MKTTIETLTQNHASLMQEKLRIEIILGNEDPEPVQRLALSVLEGRIMELRESITQLTLINTFMDSTFASVVSGNLVRQER